MVYYTQMMSLLFTVAFQFVHNCFYLVSFWPLLDPKLKENLINDWQKRLAETSWSLTGTALSQSWALYKYFDGDLLCSYLISVNRLFGPWSIKFSELMLEKFSKTKNENSQYLRKFLKVCKLLFLMKKNLEKRTKIS